MLGSRVLDSMALGSKHVVRKPELGNNPHYSGYMRRIKRRRPLIKIGFSLFLSFPLNEVTSLGACFPNRRETWGSQENFLRIRGSISWGTNSFKGPPKWAISRMREELTCVCLSSAIRKIVSIPLSLRLAKAI